MPIRGFYCNDGSATVAAERAFPASGSYFDIRQYVVRMFDGHAVQLAQPAIYSVK